MKKEGPVGSNSICSPWNLLQCKDSECSFTMFISRTILRQFHPIKILAPYLNTIVISPSQHQLEVRKWPLNFTCLDQTCTIHLSLECYASHPSHLLFLYHYYNNNVSHKRKIIKFIVTQFSPPLPYPPSPLLPSLKFQMIIISILFSKLFNRLHILYHSQDGDNK